MWRCGRVLDHELRGAGDVRGCAGAAVCAVRSGGARGADGRGAPVWTFLSLTAWRVELRSAVSVRAIAALRSPVGCGGPVTAVLRSRAAYQAAARAAAASQPPPSAHSRANAARRAPRFKVAPALVRGGEAPQPTGRTHSRTDPRFMGATCAAHGPGALRARARLEARWRSPSAPCTGGSMARGPAEGAENA